MQNKKTDVSPARAVVVNVVLPFFLKYFKLDADIFMEDLDRFIGLLVFHSGSEVKTVLRFDPVSFRM
jgi:hypothetical protein